MKNIVLISGGVDSLTTTLMLKKQNKKCDYLYVDFNHRYKQEEKKAITNISKFLNIIPEIIDMSYVSYFEKDNAEIPLRNLFVISNAALLGADNVYISIEKGTFNNLSNDRSKLFFKSTKKLLTYMLNKNIVINNLVNNYTKQDEMKYILDNYKYGKDLLLQTFSCYTPIYGCMCGECKACVRWYLAGLGVGLERKDWVYNPKDSGVIKQYVNDVKLKKYDKKRAKQYEINFKKIGLL